VGEISPNLVTLQAIGPGRDVLSGRAQLFLTKCRPESVPFLGKCTTLRLDIGHPFFPLLTCHSDTAMATSATLADVVKDARGKNASFPPLCTVARETENRENRKL
jgi:hypothetical protein